MLVFYPLDWSHGAWAAPRGLLFPLPAHFHPKGEVARRYGVWRQQDGFAALDGLRAGEPVAA